MSNLACPHCKFDNEWMGWDSLCEKLGLELKWTSGMDRIIYSVQEGSRHRSVREERSTAYLVQCPKCQKPVICLNAFTPWSDITGDWTYAVAKVEDVR